MLIKIHINHAKWGRTWQNLLWNIYSICIFNTLLKYHQHWICCFSHFNGAQNKNVQRIYLKSILASSNSFCLIIWLLTSVALGHKCHQTPIGNMLISQGFPVRITYCWNYDYDSCIPILHYCKNNMITLYCQVCERNNTFYWNISWLIFCKHWIYFIFKLFVTIRNNNKRRTKINVIENRIIRIYCNNVLLLKQ